MKFKFAFEKLLEHYKQQEEIAKRDYFESLAKLDQQKEILRAMNREFEQSLEESESLKLASGPIMAMYLETLETYREGQHIRMNRQADVIGNYQQIVDAKQDVLIAAAKEVKMLQKLKEKKYQEFKKQLKKKEAKVNDELVVTRFRRGGSL